MRQNKGRSWCRSQNISAKAAELDLKVKEGSDESKLKGVHERDVTVEATVISSFAHTVSGVFCG